MHWRGIVEEPRVTLGPCYDALWVALHAVAIATDFTSYRRTDPMYPPTLLPLLSTPAPWSFLQLQSKEKKAIWLKSKYFFSLLKIRIPEIQSRRQGNIGTHLFPKGQEASECLFQKGRLVTFHHRPPCLLHVPFYPLCSPPDYTDLPPRPPTRCLDSSARQSSNIIQRHNVDWSGQAGIRYFDILYSSSGIKEMPSDATARFKAKPE